MEYIHVKNLEQYQPGYTDRRHIWAKIYYDSFIDEKLQALCEIDKYRFWSLIVYEVFHQKPIPLTDTNLKIMGWEPRKRHISLTLQMLHTLIEVDTDNSKECTLEKSRVEKSRVEKNYTEIFENFWKAFKGRWNSDKDDYRKGSKPEAFKSWEKLTETDQQNATKGAPFSGDKYTPDCYRWLREKRWEK